jgi:hypothetical protein
MDRTCYKASTQHKLTIVQTEASRQIKNNNKTIKGCHSRKEKECWQEKEKLRHFPHNLEEQLVDKEQLYRSIKFGDIRGETESETVAAQEQEISKTNLKI